MVYTKVVQIATTRELEVIDITQHVIDCVSESEVEEGIINVFAKGSTCAITTIEYEPGLLKDIGAILNRISPDEDNFEYMHQKRWNDFNGHSHTRASILKPSLTVPIVDSKPVLGTWQQVVFVELDIRKREREVILTVIGEKAQPGEEAPPGESAPEP